MVSRASLVTVLLSFSFSILANAQVNPKLSELLSTPNRWNVNLGSVGGTVRGPQGDLAGGVRVELQDADTGATVASTFTQQNGTFELYNISAGNYQVVAKSGFSQATDTVSVRFGQENVSLRFQNAAPSRGSRNTVSVAEMLVPNKARGLYQKAQVACTKGKFDDAQKLLDRAVQIDPQFAEALTLRGLIQLRANHIDQGRQDFEQAIQYDPNYGPAYVGLGAAYNAQAHYDDALRTLERETAISPTAWQGYLEMAKASIGKGMYDKGLQYAEKAEQLNGSHLPVTHLLKAYAMIPLKFYSRAKQELQAYLQREPKGGNAERARNLLAQLNASELETASNRQ